MKRENDEGLPSTDRSSRLHSKDRVSRRRKPYEDPLNENGGRSLSILTRDLASTSNPILDPRRNATSSYDEPSIDEVPATAYTLSDSSCPATSPRIEHVPATATAQNEVDLYVRPPSSPTLVTSMEPNKLLREDATTSSPPSEASGSRASMGIYQSASSASSSESSSNMSVNEPTMFAAHVRGQKPGDYELKEEEDWEHIDLTHLVREQREVTQLKHIAVPTRTPQPHSRGRTFLTHSDGSKCLLEVIDSLYPPAVPTVKPRGKKDYRPEPFPFDRMELKWLDP